MISRQYFSVIILLPILHCIIIKDCILRITWKTTPTDSYCSRDLSNWRRISQISTDCFIGIPALPTFKLEMQFYLKCIYRFVYTFQQFSVLVVHLRLIFSLSLLTESHNFQLRDVLSTSKTQFPPKTKEAIGFVLLHLKEIPTCLHLSSHLCAMRHLCTEHKNTRHVQNTFYGLQNLLQCFR